MEQWGLVDEVFQAWLDAEYASPEEQPKLPTAEEVEEQFATLLLRPRESLELFQLCHAMDWKHLPFAGGMLDQPDWFLHDIKVLSSRMAYLRKLTKAGKDKSGLLNRQGWLARVRERRAKRG